MRMAEQILKNEVDKITAAYNLVAIGRSNHEEKERDRLMHQINELMEAIWALQTYRNLKHHITRRIR